jgi:hypothetical protein
LVALSALGAAFFEFLAPKPALVVSIVQSDDDPTDANDPDDLAPLPIVDVRLAVGHAHILPLPDLIEVHR